jgi:two-component system, cell cycle response regulator DivK
MTLGSSDGVHNSPQPAVKRVLIVEDNDMNMRLFNAILEAHGYSTLGATHGVQGIVMARGHCPDLIIMDIQLPDMSGLDVTRALKGDPALARIPVLAVTAYAMKGDEEKCREAGCDAYLSKPITMQSLLDASRALCGGPRGDND